MTASLSGNPPSATAPQRHPLVFSVDLEEWFHARWATGYAKSIWRDLPTFFRDVYGGDRPRGDVIPPVRWLLDFCDRQQVRATFFILGEIAEWYPHLVREVAARGHEIACHSLRHADMSQFRPDEFARNLADAKERLEDLAGRPVRGFRAPNLVVEPWLADVLEQCGFRYDSSICPARGFRGKYANMAACSQHPYRTGATIQEQGRRPLWEIPITSMPFILMPAGSAIATRFFGLTWTRFALAWWNRRGSVQYYLHPYEIWTDTLPPQLSRWARLMTRHRGPWMQEALRRIIDAYKPHRILTCEQRLAELPDYTATFPSPLPEPGNRGDGVPPSPQTPPQRAATHFSPSTIAESAGASSQRRHSQPVAPADSATTGAPA